MKIKITLLALIFAYTINAQNWIEKDKIVSLDREAYDLFGMSVSASGNYVVIGAKQEKEDVNGENPLNNAGSVYIYFNNEGFWEQVQKIVPSDRESGNLFGQNVAISGDYIVVGTPSESEDANGANTLYHAGSIYIFKNNDGTWEEIQKIAPLDRAMSARFGSSVAISGDYIIVGAEAESKNIDGSSLTSRAGAAYIFKNYDGTWEQEQKIIASDRGVDDYFGHSVDISGNYLIVGAYAEDEDVNGNNTLDGAGAAYIFYNNGTNWVETQKIVASDRNSGDSFALNVAINGSNAAIGAHLESEDSNGENTLENAGSVYVYSGNGETWENVQKIVASDRGSFDSFGVSVDISDDYIIVGASRESEDLNGENSIIWSGSAYIYHNNSNQWNEIQKIVASDRGMENEFGHSVAISGTNIVVGAFGQDMDANGENQLNYAGAAYIFSTLPLIYENPQDQTETCVDNSISFSVKGSGINNYQWQVSTNNGESFENITNSSIYSGIQTSTLSFALVPELNGNQFRCVVSNDNGTVMSEAAILTIESEHPIINSTHPNKVLDALANCETNIPSYIEDVIATDNCDTDLEVTQTPTAGTLISGSTNEVTLTVTDDAGNSSSVSFNAAVEDNTAPTINCQQNQTVKANGNDNSYTVSGTEFDPISTEDNCTVASITNNFNNSSTLDGEVLPLGHNNITWTITDDAGNTSVCSCEITVNQTTGFSDLTKSGISIYPNPTNGHLKVNFGSNKVTKLIISDLGGKQVFKKSDLDQVEEIDLTEFKNGVYLISIFTNDKTYNSKIVKE